MRRIAISVAVSTMTLSLAGCGVLDATGGVSDASPTKGDAITVGLLLPETANTRYARFDHPIIADKVAELTAKHGKVDYANANASAARQARQMRKMVDDRVDVILVDAVDSHAIAPEVKHAKDEGIPVIAYDRLAEGPIDAYISFDNELVGEVQGRSLLDALGSGSGVHNKIVMMNGSPTDPNARQFKEGAFSELNGKVTIAQKFDTTEWKPEIAQANMAQTIRRMGASNISAVYAANDGIAGGVIKALKAAGVTHLPPITGQDAELDAVQRIVTGEQYMSVYKSYPDEAQAAAEMAVAKVQGKNIQFDALTRDKVDSPTNRGIPAQLVQVSALTRRTIKQTVIADGIYSVDAICTPKYKAACAAAGLK
ncbi:sugar ABC transporter substrate-binding protein [Streptomyces sp. V3I7]|uniref:sugar ABC transporter substrate-binding protein n=1 Tax=Streptomyces sp. V3I7 TaxID=3042278 RepID=UPI0027840BE3|nr:substrate-binding domain-containing protein [Streptomyces sp. V3I7]MDQ0992042.1 D-xylose transport system substrate-binding protein [Streptomyces sp. V3I7]